MNKFIALLRGINVGGRNKLPMKDLTATLVGAGYESIKTYIQSGNVVFESGKTDTQVISDSVAGLIEQHHGFRPAVLILTVEKYKQALENAPFAHLVENPSTLHLFFLEALPDAPNLDKLEALKSASEQFELRGDVFYLYAPDGIGRSKLAEQVEKAMGVPVTARNWRSAQKILELAEKT